MDARGFCHTRTQISFLLSEHRQTRTVTISLRLGGARRIGPWALLGEGTAADLRPGGRHRRELSAGSTALCLWSMRQPVPCQPRMFPDTPAGWLPVIPSRLPSRGMRGGGPCLACAPSPLGLSAESQGPWTPPPQTARLQHTLELGNLPEKPVKF